MRKKVLMLALVNLLIMGSPLLSQAPPPPDRDDIGGPVGGSAPIGDGTIILIFLAVVYAIRKAYLLRQRVINADKKTIN